MAHTISIAVGAADLNQYQVRHKEGLRDKMRQGLELEGYLPYVSCDYAYAVPNATPSNVIQPYQAAFTPVNTDTIDSVENRLQNLKVDLEFDALQLEKFFNKWKSNWFELGKSPIEWSFPRYMVQEIIWPKMTEELNWLSYNGDYAAPTAGTAGAYTTSVDGFKIKIEDAITASKLTPVASGSFTGSDIRAKLEAWIDGFPIPYRNAPGTVFMSVTNATRYYRNFRAEFGWGAGNINNENKTLDIDGYAGRKRIMPLASMEGSNRWIFVPDGVQSMIVGTRTGQPVFPELRFEAFERKLKCMGEFSRFFGFEHYNDVIVNDQA